MRLSIVMGALGTCATVLLCAVAPGVSETVSSERNPRVVALNGADVCALIAASDALKALPDLRPTQRSLARYSVKLSHKGSHYFVHFVPDAAPGEQDRAGGETSFGKEVRFTVRKGDYRVVDHVFFE